MSTPNIKKTFFPHKKEANIWSDKLQSIKNMAPLTRGKRKQGERQGRIELLRPKRKDPERIIRRKNKLKKTKLLKEREASTYEPFNLLSIELIQYILSFVGIGHYVFLASVSQEFRATLTSISGNDFKTEPSSYIHSWKLIRWIMKVPKNSPNFMRPTYKSIMFHAMKYDSLNAFIYVRVTKRRIRPGIDWKSFDAVTAIKHSAIKILKWLIEEQYWDYSSHKEQILKVSTSCNLEMITYLHEHLKIEFDITSLSKMILETSCCKEAIRYVLGIVPSMTALEHCRVLHNALLKENNDVAKMLCEELHDPDMVVYGVQSCCREERGINLVKSIINTEIADQMDGETYMRVILEACGEGRVDILKYLEEEVCPIPYLDILVQHFADEADHRNILEYLVEVMNGRE
ncbi:predicted protein [Chaetoceros tenuissimus]|uniref:F-box domain-containing protein n=1 Tax=Chaetoceros tenuissimus TaxID=426638 RepID=A0AAD3DCM8_9STRA|nr:predicted protein [Chaetoceros tenuissimus]